MDKLILSAKEIYEKDFPTTKHGYDIQAVNDYLDNIIKDYVQMKTILEDYQILQKVVAEQKQQIIKLKQQVAETYHKTQVIPTNKVTKAQPIANATNLDLLKRVANLEAAVFGNKNNKLDS